MGRRILAAILCIVCVTVISLVIWGLRSSCVIPLSTTTEGQNFLDVFGIGAHIESAICVTERYPDANMASLVETYNQFARRDTPVTDLTDLYGRELVLICASGKVVGIGSRGANGRWRDSDDVVYLFNVDEEIAGAEHLRIEYVK
jgi:hypothetical protein